MALDWLCCTEQLMGWLDEAAFEQGALMLTMPLTRLKRGSGHRLLLLEAGSSEKRPV